MPFYCYFKLYSSLSLVSSIVILKAIFVYTMCMKHSRRALNKEKSRRSILKASRKLFSDQGYDETLIEEIADLAEVSKATVYNYFPDKDSLLIAIVEEVEEGIEDYLDAELSAETNALDKIRRVLTELVLASLQYPGLSRRIVFLNSSRTSTLHGTLNEIKSLLYQLIAAAQSDGCLSAEISAGEILDLLMGMHFIALFQWTGEGIASAQDQQDKLDRLFDSVMQQYFI